MIDITLPEIGEGVTEATIVQWNVEIGEQVTTGSVIVEIMTDKVNIEVEAQHAGTITEILHGNDEEVRIGTVIARLEPATTGEAAQ